jgi:hypothetical protein
VEWNVQWSNWNDVFERAVSSADSAIELIQEVQRTLEIPALVEFFNDQGVSLGMGVGRPTTVLTYQTSNGPPYFISLGDPAAEGSEWFCYGNEESEYLARNLIDFDIALRALREFVETGKKSSNVSWEQL